MSRSEIPRVILAIEASTPAASVAVRDPEGTLFERTVPTGDRSRDHLPPSIEDLLREADIDRRGLHGIAVSEGPGGFTGLRISVALAQGIAEALRIPTLGVASAAVAAAGTLDEMDRRDALVVMATKRGTAWVERVESVGEPPRRISSGGRIVDHGTAPDVAIDEGVVLADPRQDPSVVAALAAHAATTVEPRFSAAALLGIAERTPPDAGWGDPARLAVRYPRVPEAVSKWRAASVDR